MRREKKSLLELGLKKPKPVQLAWLSCPAHEAGAVQLLRGLHSDHCLCPHSLVRKDIVPVTCDGKCVRVGFPRKQILRQRLACSTFITKECSQEQHLEGRK